MFSRRRLSLNRVRRCTNSSERTLWLSLEQLFRMNAPCREPDRSVFMRGRESFEKEKRSSGSVSRQL